MTLLEVENNSIFLQIRKKVHSKCIPHCPHGWVNLVICNSTADGLLFFFFFYLGNVALKGLGVILIGISKSSVLPISSMNGWCPFKRLYKMSDRAEKKC